ncbi:MAG: HAD family acid phosphatase [Verrucomicrobia bacterium]|nr:HAD family acid phosphatase [Verrucomicrobiota bacterium]
MLTGLAGGWTLGMGPGVATAAEPRNIDQLKNEIRAYVKSGDYGREMAAIAGRAEAWLAERGGKQASGERLAVVFDLDETLLSNWAFIEEHDIGGSDALWQKWMAQGEAAVVEPVREVYRTARRLGIEVYFITGRRERLREGTEKNLRVIGCGEYGALIMKPNDWKGTAAAYKTGERARIERTGRRIVANLGDQDSDLAGGHAERTFKFPDPFYFTP